MKTRKSYDPGRPGETRHLGGRQFAVQSFRNPEDWYVVDLDHGTCSCPHFEKRVGPALDAGEEIDRCKHFRLAQAAQLRVIREKAQSMSPARIREALRRYSYRPEVEGTIREVLQEKLLDLIADTSAQVRVRDYCRV
jgi:hypothetical protein